MFAGGVAVFFLMLDGPLGRDDDVAVPRGLAEPLAVFPLAGPPVEFVLRGVALAVQARIVG